MKPKNRVIAEYAFVSALCLLASIAEATRLNSLQTQNAETPLLTFNGYRTNTSPRDISLVSDASQLEKVLSNRSPARRMRSSNDCSLSEEKTAKYYDAASKVWMVDDVVVEELDGKLHLITGCATDGDVVLFKTTKTVQPKKKLTIRHGITLSAYVDDVTVFRSETIPTIEDKTVFSCPSTDEGLFSIQSTNVVLANMIVQDCHLVGDVPIEIHSCGESATRSNVLFANVDFLRNTHPHGSAAVETAAPSCSDLKFVNSHFEENACEESHVGIVRTVLGATVTALKTKAVANRCTVFMAEQSEMNITASEFRQNQGVQIDGKNEARGAALRYDMESTGHIIDSTFVANTAKYGGSISVSSKSRIWGKNLHFKSNKAAHGGAMHISDSYAHLTNSEFSKNEADDRGGAVNTMNGSDFNTELVTFERNIAESGGGLSQQEGRCFMKKTSFVANSCKTHGGGLFALQNATIQGKNLVFRKNKASAGGGAFIQESTATITSSNFTKNSIIDNDGEGGGAYLTGSHMNGTDLRIFENKAYNGAGISLHTSSSVDLADTVLSSNNAVHTGGAVYIGSRSSIVGRRLSIKSNGATHGGGVMIDADSTAEIVDTVVESNIAKEYGGAVTVSKSVFTVSRSRFLSNKAKNGGSVFSQNGRMTISDADFSSNVADEVGGGIFSASNPQMVAKKTVFSNNAANLGGALMTTSSKASLEACTFKGNKGHLKGGAIFAQKAKLSARDSIAEGNGAQEGAGFHLTSTPTDLKNTSFVKNKAEANGGGLYVLNCDFNATALTMTENEAKSGAGLYLDKSKSFSLSKSMLIQNQAITTGGAVHMINSKIECTGLTVSQNSGAEGGAFYAKASDIHLTGLSLSENNASQNGGAIAAHSSTLEGSDLAVENNVAEESGGGFYLAENSNMVTKEITFTGNKARNGGAAKMSSGEAHVSSCIFQENEASSQGGAFFAKESIVHATDSIVEDNAAFSGAGLYLTRAETELRNTSLLKNKATEDGGALYLVDSSLDASDLKVMENEANRAAGLLIARTTSTILSRSTLSQNRAKTTGGACHIATSKVECTELTVSQNAAAEGGAFYAETSDLNLTGLSLSGNHASRNGGAIAARRCTLEGTDLKVEDNVAEVSGGGVLVRFGERTSLKSSYFLRNRAEVSGGALLVNSSSVDFQGLIVEGNSAKSGGGISLERSSSSIQNTSFGGNSAVEGGGAVWALSSTLSFSGVDVRNNEATEGAGLHISMCDAVTLTETAFKGNEAKKSGGAVYSLSSGQVSAIGVLAESNRASFGSGFFVRLADRLRLTDSRFSTNEADNSGGALYVVHTRKAELDGNQISQNKATYGAGCYIEETECKLSRTVFQENAAVKHGGAINTMNVQRFDGESLELIENRAKFGGGLYIQESAVNLSQCTFTKNAADDTGGAVEATMDSSLSVENAVFDKNTAESGGGLSQSASQSLLKNVTFSANTCQKSGGGLFGLQSSVIQGEHLVFQYNEAMNGGGLFIQESTAVVKQSSFVNNEVKDDGAGVCAVSSKLNGSDLVLDGNEALSGAGLTLRSNASSHLVGVTFTNNKASHNGGAALMTEKSILDGRELTIKNNMGGMGGALTATFESKVNIEDSILESNIGNTAGGALALHASASTATRVAFIDNRAPIGGGAYCREGNLELSNADISSNRAASNGAAVYLSVKSKMVAEKSVFLNNRARQGGVVMTIGSEAHLKSCSLKSNEGYSKGGAIYAERSAVSASDSIVENCTALNGAGLYLTRAETELRNTSLLKNKATEDGGALYLVDSSLDASDLKVMENEANRAAGLLIARTTSTILSRSTLSQNRAKTTGGACHIATSKVECTELTVSQNAAAEGGAFYAETSDLNLTGLSLSGNHASRNGGAIAARRCTLEGTDLKVEDNVAEVSGGGVLVRFGERTSLKSSYFLRNRAEVSGGALLVNSSSVDFQGLIVEGNSAKSGGGISLERSSSSIQNTSFGGNSAVEGGGAVWALSSTLSFSGVDVRNNEATEGAGLHISMCDAVTLTETAFKGNEAKKSGGAVYSLSSGQVSAIGVLAESNRASFGSGFFVRLADRLRLTDSRFSTNEADNSGGALYVVHTRKAELDGNQISQNKATYGAGCYIEETECKLSRTVFQENSAVKHGGAINTMNVQRFDGESLELIENRAKFGGGLYIQESAVNLSQCTFTKNAANDTGGAINSIMSSEITCDQSDFKQNHATFGGAVYASENEILFNNCSFIENFVSYDGGALAATAECVVSCQNSHFIRNRAKNGGAIRLQYNSDMALRETQLSENKAEEAGGALHVSLAKHLQLSDVKFTDNEAQLHGGGCHLEDVSNAILLRSKLISNKATRGAALVAMSHSTIEVSDSVFETNVASTEGGGVRLIDSHFTGHGSRFSENSAGSGAAIFAKGASSLRLQSLIVERNTAQHRGGGIAIDAEKKTAYFELEDSTFTKNRAEFGGALYYVRDNQQATECTNAFEDICQGMNIWNTEFLHNEADFSGAIALLSDPFGFRFSCAARSSSASMQSLDPLLQGAAADEQTICLNWKNNGVLENDLRIEEFGSYARDVNVKVNETHIPNYPSVNNGKHLVQLDNVLSGLSLPRMDLKSVDAFGNELEPSTEGDFWAKLVAPEGFFKHGTEIGIQLIDGKEMFADVVCVAEPGNYTLELLYGNSVVNGSIPIVTHVAGCPAGTLTSNDQGCVCRHGEVFKNGVCVACPKGSICNSQFATPVNGRWHKSPCHDQTQRCLIDEACQPNAKPQALKAFVDEMETCELNEEQLDAYENLMCAEEYESTLCGRCRDGYGPSSKWKCEKCMDLLWNIVLFLVMVSWLGFLSYVQIARHRPVCKRLAMDRDASPLASRVRNDNQSPLLSRDMSTDDNTEAGTGASTSADGQRARIDSVPEDREVQHPLPQIYVSTTSFSNIERTIEIETNKLAELLKILMNYLQVSTVLSSLNINWMSSTRRALEFGGSLGGVATLVASFVSDCTISRYWSLNKPLLRLILGLCMPVFVCFCVIVCAIVWNAHSGNAFRSFPQFVLLTLSVVSYISYLGITKLAVTMFYCISVSDSVDSASSDKSKVLADDTSLECYTGAHWILIGIALAVLVFFCVGFPLFSLLRIKRRVRRGSLRAATVGHSLGYMFWPFRRRYYFWETLVFARKALLAGICVFSYSFSGNQQQAIAVVILTFFLYIQVAFSPYGHEFSTFNAYEASSLFLSTVTVSLGMVFDDDDVTDHVRFFVALVLGGLNILFFIGFLAPIFRSLRAIRSATA